MMDKIDLDELREFSEEEFLRDIFRYEMSIEKVESVEKPNIVRFTFLKGSNDIFKLDLDFKKSDEFVSSIKGRYLFLKEVQHGKDKSDLW